MKLTRMCVLLLCGLALVCPAWSQLPQATLADVVSGKAAPLTVPLNTLTKDWVRITVGQPGVSEMTRVFVGMMGGGTVNVFFTRGTVIVLEGEKYLVGYGYPAQPPNPKAMREGPQAPEPPKPDTQLTLSLLKLQMMGNLLDIRPFDLARELGGNNDAGNKDGGDKEVNAAGVAEQLKASIDNTRRILVAIMLYAQDHRETLPPLKSWVADAKIADPLLTVPGTNDRYAYNPSLGGKSLGDFEHPEKTVIVYEPNARPDGKRVVGFMDGHVEVMDAEGWVRAKKFSGIP